VRQSTWGILEDVPVPKKMSSVAVGSLCSNIGGVKRCFEFKDVRTSQFICTLGIFTRLALSGR